MTVFWAGAELLLLLLELLVPPAGAELAAPLVVLPPPPLLPHAASAMEAPTAMAPSFIPRNARKIDPLTLVGSPPEGPGSGAIRGRGLSLVMPGTVTPSGRGP